MKTFVYLGSVVDGQGSADRYAIAMTGKKCIALRFRDVEDDKGNNAEDPYFHQHQVARKD